MNVFASALVRDAAGSNAETGRWAGKQEPSAEVQHTSIDAPLESAAEQFVAIRAAALAGRSFLGRDRNAPHKSEGEQNVVRPGEGQSPVGEPDLQAVGRVLLYA